MVSGNGDFLDREPGIKETGVGCQLPVLDRRQGEEYRRVEVAMVVEE